MANLSFDSIQTKSQTSDIAKPKYEPAIIWLPAVQYLLSKTKSHTLYRKTYVIIMFNNRWLKRELNYQSYQITYLMFGLFWILHYYKGVSYPTYIKNDLLLQSAP